MATSYSRRVAFSPTLADEESLIKEPRPPSPKDDQRLRREKPGITKESGAFHRSPDRHSFAHLAKVLVSGERTQMLDAVDRLQGRSRVLTELALFSGFQFVRLAAVSHLSRDTEALADIAKFCQFDDTRAAALDEASGSKEAVIDVACSSLFRGTRIAAVTLLPDQESLGEVASKSPNLDSRSAAMERIAAHPLALKKVAENSPYRRTRLDAVKKLSSNMTALRSLAVGSRNPDVRKMAAWLLSQFVEALDDVDALAEVAKLSSSQDARYLAIGRLWHHPWALRKVVAESRYRDARSAALMMLSDMVLTLNDPDLIAEVAMMSPYRDCRSAAIEKLVGQSGALLTVASKSKFRDTRSLAIQKLKGDPSALKNLVKLAKYSDTRAQAHKMVSSPEVFKSELERILG